MSPNFEDMQAAAEATNAKFGSIDSLVVSAGIQRYGTAVSTDDDQWDEVLNVNLKGAWNAARATIPFLQICRRRNDRKCFVCPGSREPAERFGVHGQQTRAARTNALDRDGFREGENSS